jgi:glucose-1-phosphate cytidylyltransferase
LKAVILAGGLGSRLSEETQAKPKPMVEIGGRPILWHLMKLFTAQGVTEFVICLGYRGYVIKEFFANYFLHMSDVTFDMRTNQMEIHERHAEPWRVTLVDTGENTQTGGRLKRVRHHVDNEEAFFFTYGDGLSDVDLSALLDFHRAQGRLATVTAVMPPGRFGAIEIDAGRVAHFEEKPVGEGGVINGGFFVINPKAIDLIEGDHMPWEARPMATLVAENQLSAYRHAGFWQPMDTLRDKNHLDALWNSGAAPWKLWD